MKLLTTLTLMMMKSTFLRTMTLTQKNIGSIKWKLKLVKGEFLKGYRMLPVTAILSMSYAKMVESFAKRYKLGTIKVLKVKVQRTEKMMDAEWAKHRKNDKPEKLSEEEWEDLKDMATSTICLCLANNTLREVLSLTDLVDIWDKLESRYKSKSLTSRLYLKKRLFGLQMAEKANFNGHLDKFNKITTELDSIDVKIEEEDKALLLLASLPSSFDNIVTTLLFGKETLKFDEVVAALLMNETRRGGNGVSNDSQALVAEGAVKEQFDTYQTCDGSAVKMENGARSKIAGVGTVQVHMFDGVVRTLTGVKHIPGLKGNLISLGALDSEGCRIFAQGEVLKFSRGAMVVAKGVLSNDLFKLVGKDLTRKLSEGKITSAASGAFAWKKRMTFEASQVGGDCDLAGTSVVEPDHGLVN
ncbi:unnamed protein product [Cuscuta campestris]|uniref:Retrovirus-related Pol polyprotein from transposon TNT 1-94-like beta-barrel domain-containing protein n=1 Tax=Cuscuta campestris TaxID=132261 RepID=A0A484LED9_9ASTE|nr:unnamed protein product [Cuscuta campestris]